MTPPPSFDEIVNEIAGIIRQPREKVADRVWREALQLGSNVGEDVVRLGVRPHESSPAMDRLYSDGDGFIFETMVFWATPNRQRWLEQSLDRVAKHAERIGVPASRLRIMVLGDGSGSDSLRLAAEGFHVDYFDVPGSRTFAFAMQRFVQHGVLDTNIRVITEYDACFRDPYDVVLCIEVLEHLPDPEEAIRGISRMLRPGGLALITESFGLVTQTFPTHLRSNLRFDGRTPFLFLRHGLHLTWYSRAPMFRPSEFTLRNPVSWRDRVALLLNRNVAKRWLKALPKRWSLRRRQSHVASAR